MRRILALALTFVMLLSLVSIGTYAAEPVARIIKADKTERGTYTTIASAVAALEDGDTLELLASINEGFTLNVDGRNLTIIGSTGITVGGKIQLDNSGSYSSSAIGHVVLKDFSINHSKGEHALAIWNTMVVEAENLTLSVTRQGSTVFALATSNSSKSKLVTATFRNCNFIATGNQTYAAYLRSNNHITFIDCDINYTGGNSAAVMIDQTFGKGCVEFDGCSITSAKGIYKSTSNDAYVIFRNSNLTYTGSGSAMLYLGGNTSVDIYNTVFTNNNGGSCLNKTDGSAPNVRLYSATFVNGKKSSTMQPIRFDIPKYAPKSLSVSYGTPLTWDLGQRKVDAEAEIKAITSGSTNPTIKGIETAAVTNIWEPMTYEGVAQAKSSALEELAPWTEAEAELREYSSGATDARVLAVVNSYVNDIWSETNSSSIAFHLSDAKVAYDFVVKKVEAEAAIREYASSATDQRILDVVSSACVEVWTKETNSAIEQVKTKAFADIDVFNSLIAIADEIRELTSTATDKRITDYAMFARLAAENEVKDYANGSTQQVIVAIVSSAIDEIWSSATSTGILPAVVQEYKNQIDTYKATIDAEAAIREYRRYRIRSLHQRRSGCCCCRS